MPLMMLLYIFVGPEAYLMDLGDLRHFFPKCGSPPEYHEHLSNKTVAYFWENPNQRRKKWIFWENFFLQIL